jgi:hypothetical protein
MAGARTFPLWMLPSWVGGPSYIIATRPANRSAMIAELPR